LNLKKLRRYAYFLINERLCQRFEIKSVVFVFRVEDGVGTKVTNNVHGEYQISEVKFLKYWKMLIGLIVFGWDFYEVVVGEVLADFWFVFLVEIDSEFGQFFK